MDLHSPLAVLLFLNPLCIGWTFKKKNHFYPLYACSLWRFWTSCTSLCSHRLAFQSKMWTATPIASSTLYSSISAPLHASSVFLLTFMFWLARPVHATWVFVACCTLNRPTKPHCSTNYYRNLQINDNSRHHKVQGWLKLLHTNNRMLYNIIRYSSWRVYVFWDGILLTLGVTSDR